MKYRFDLIALVADADTEWTIRTLIGERYQSLKIEPVQFKIIRHPMRDSGVFNNASTFLRPYIHQTHYALAVLDWEGSGREHKKSAQEMETELEEQLRRQGWDANRACAIVLDPELEVWVWSPSPHIAGILGVSQQQLAQILKDDFPLVANGKPERPKEAMQAVLRASGRPFSARIFQELAQRVSLQPSERAFDKFRATLQKWFSSEDLGDE